jgi:flagellar hook-associated protein 2
MTTFDPTTTATQLATAYTKPMQSLLDTQAQNAQTTSSALTKLSSVLSTFDTSLSGLSGKKSMVANTASFSDSSYGTVSASGSAQAGSYSLFVQQIATASQVAVNNIPASTAVGAAGSFAINLAGGSSFNVNLTTADTDGSGTVSPTEIARAINQASGNSGLVSATVVTSNGQSQLILTAGNTGASGAISIGSVTSSDTTLANALNNPNTLTSAQDAIVWLGGQNSGIQLQQASNTFTSIPGVSMTFSKAMANGTTPITLTVSRDDSGTAANVKTFVDAYNTLEKALDDLTNPGNAANNVAASAFASDAGVLALRGKLNTLIHQSVGGVSLMDYGITMDRYGQLSLDSSKLSAKLATNPDGLTTLFGNTGLTTSGGLLGSLDKYINVWTNSLTGQIKTRQDSLGKIQTSISKQQTQLDDQYSQAYQRYLLQFTKLQEVQSQMSQTTSMFSSLFSTSGN